MKSFFNSQEAQAKLSFVAARWIGTPWAANSSARGQGVSCHNLPRAIYVECGALPESFPAPVRNPAQDRHSGSSFMEKFVNSRPEFRRLEVGVDALLPGDLIGIRIYRVVDHLGVVLTGGNFVHVMMHKKTCLDPFTVSPWMERVEAAWRVEV